MKEEWLGKKVKCPGCSGVFLAVATRSKGTAAHATAAKGSATERALAILKGKENPFEILAAGQRADDNFDEIHVPAVNQRERELVLKIIDTYRTNEYADNDPPPKTRVVIVQGARGSGKTHLLQSLVGRPDRRPQVIVRPAFFEPSLPFEEYLLAELRTALAQQTEFHAERPLDSVARGLTRRLLHQALLGTGPADRLFALHGNRPLAFRLLWGAANESLRRIEKFLAQLKDPSARDLPALLDHFGLSTQMAFRLVAGHLRVRESGPDMLVQMRRLFYSALARKILLTDHEAVARFFSEEYEKAAPAEPKPSRGDLVQCQLDMLLETCTLVRMPVIFAFDNLERLFAPQNQVDGELIRTFLNTLAQATDNTRGLLFLLFAEGGLFAEQVVPNMDEFARLRLEQGAPVPGQGPVYLVRLPEPGYKEVELLVQTRVRPLLAELDGFDAIPPAFPFGLRFLQEVVGGQGSVQLRNVLYALRDEYNRIVYKKPLPAHVPAPAPGPVVSTVRVPSPVPSRVDSPALTSVAAGGTATVPQVPPTPRTDLPGVLDEVWNRSFQVARKWVESMSHHDLHNCLGAMLQACLPLAIDAWDLVKVAPVVTAGDHLEYGVVSVLDWKQRDGAAARGPQSIRLGVGFVLAGGPGMAFDLRAKFDYLKDKFRGVRLLILWQTTRKCDPQFDALPQATRKVWDQESGNHWRTELRRVEESDIRRVLAFQGFLERAEEVAGLQPPAEDVRALLHKKLNKVFPLFVPQATSAPE
jgi:hypothetical protein